jgi:hypothetical protein
MTNTFTARDTLKTKLLAALNNATNADQIVKLSRTIEKANLDDDADLETALDTKVSAMADTASTEDIEKLAFGVKKLRTETTATDPVSSMIPEGSSNLYVTQDRVRGSFSASGDLSYDSGTGVLSYTALPDALTVYPTVADLPSSGVAAGAKGIVEENKKLYIFTGASWIGVGLVDQKPSFTTTPDGSYSLTPGGDTVITLSATDPQGDPITFSHVVSAGSLGGSTVSQSGNVFTITGSSDTNDTAPFSITFRVSDGTNIADTTSEFTVQFALPPKIVVGALGDNSNTGAVYVYDLDGSNEVKIYASDAEPGDKFGHFVAIGHDKIVVGSVKGKRPGSSDKVGAVYVYDINDLSGGVTQLWSNQFKINATDAAADDEYGCSVAIGNNKIVVGSRYDDDAGSLSGSVYVYDLDGSNEVKITASDAAYGDQFGHSVSVNYNKIVVGALSRDEYGGDTGVIYIYDLDGSNEIKIAASDHTNPSTGAYLNSGDNFGYSVAVGDNKIAVGAPRDMGVGGTPSYAGAVYVYDLDGSNEVKITASDRSYNDFFGSAVAVGNNKIIVGAYGDDSSRGSVYVYDLDGSNEVKITASDRAYQDGFGTSVAVRESKIIVGQVRANVSSAVYIYDLDGSNEVKFTSSDNASSDKFGISVAIG